MKYQWANKECMVNICVGVVCAIYANSDINNFKINYIGNQLDMVMQLSMYLTSGDLNIKYITMGYHALLSCSHAMRLSSSSPCLCQIMSLLP